MRCSTSVGVFRSKRAAASLFLQDWHGMRDLRLAMVARLALSKIPKMSLQSQLNRLPAAFSQSCRPHVGASPARLQECPKSPQRRPGTSRRAPRRLRESATTTKIGTKLRPGANPSSLAHAACSESTVRAILHQCSSMCGFVANSENAVSYSACQRKTMLGPA